MKIVFQSKNNSNKTFKMVSRREEKKKRRVSLMWKIAFISIWVREGMFWVRCLIRFHNKSHRRNCMSIRRQLTVYYSWMGFTWCFIIIVENSGIFFSGHFSCVFMCVCLFRHHIHSESNYERKIKISSIGMSMAVNFVCIAYEKRKEGTGFQLISINCISWYELNATKTEKNSL